MKCKQSARLSFVRPRLIAGVMLVCVGGASWANALNWASYYSRLGVALSTADYAWFSQRISLIPLLIVPLMMFYHGISHTGIYAKRNMYLYPSRGAYWLILCRDALAEALIGGMIITVCSILPSLGNKNPLPTINWSGVRSIFALMTGSPLQVTVPPVLVFIGYWAVACLQVMAYLLLYSVLECRFYCRTAVQFGFQQPAPAFGVGLGQPKLWVLDETLWHGGSAGRMGGTHCHLVPPGPYGLSKGGCVVKKSTRSCWAMIGQDIALSWQDARWGLGIGGLLFIAATMQYQASLGAAVDVQIIPALSDYIIFAFAGNEPFVNGSGAPFMLPITWFVLIFFCIHSCALFPSRMMRGVGVGRLFQAGSRLKWWCRLTFLVVLWCAAYVLLGLLCMAVIGIIRYGVCQIGTVQADLIGAVFFTLCVLSEIQAICSALASPLAGELINAVLMVCAAFWDHPALWPRYSMLLRSNTVEANGFIPARALVYLIVSFLGIFALSALLFQKSNILSHDKER